MNYGGIGLRVSTWGVETVQLRMNAATKSRRVRGLVDSVTQRGRIKGQLFYWRSLKPPLPSHNLPICAALEKS